MSKSLERRRRERYGMEVEVQYLVLKDGKTVRSGSGFTRNVSAGGIFFVATPEISLDPGSVIYLEAKWPVRFQRTTRVDWIVHGVVVRSEARGVAVEILKQHLARRTRNAAAEQAG